MRGKDDTPVVEHGLHELFLRMPGDPAVDHSDGLLPLPSPVAEAPPGDGIGLRVYPHKHFRHGDAMRRGEGNAHAEFPVVPYRRPFLPPSNAPDEVGPGHIDLCGKHGVVELTPEKTVGVERLQRPSAVKAYKFRLPVDYVGIPDSGHGPLYEAGHHLVVGVEEYYISACHGLKTTIAGGRSSRAGLLKLCDTKTGIGGPGRRPFAYFTH